MQQETMRGFLFPLFPLRLKCQNHERVPISPISPILVANVYSSCQDMDHQKRGNRDPLSPRVKCQNHERVPISPISPILVANVYSSCQDMGHQNRGNRDPLNVFPWWSAKTMRGSLFPLFPLFWWPMSIHPVKAWTTKKGEIGTIFPLFPLRVKCQNHERVPISPIFPILVANVYSSCEDMDHQNRGNRDPLNVFPWWSAKTMRGSLFPLFPLRVKCQNHERVPISPISPIFRAYLFILPRHGPPK